MSNEVKENGVEDQVSMTEVKKNVVAGQKNEILNALKSKFATSVNSVYVNSIDQNVSFKEINVAEQKTLSRIMLDNEDRMDIVYDAQCASINKVCLNEGFDIYKMTEFDKIKIQLAMYQQNVVKNEIQFTCKECGTENKYKIDFKDTIQKLDDFDISPKTFTFEDRIASYSVVLEYPVVRRVSEFYRGMIKRYRHDMKKHRQQINIEYVNLFIKSISFKTNGSDEETFIDMSQIAPVDVSDIISEFPQDLLYDEKGVISYVTENMIQSINNTFSQHKCENCGHVQEDTSIDSYQSFL